MDTESFCIGVKPIKVSVFVLHIFLQCSAAYLDIDLIAATYDVTDCSFEIGRPNFIAMWRIHRYDTQIKYITIDIKNFVTIGIQKIGMISRWDRD